ncbi:MAG: beta-lactamase family protein [Armatimonadetes bacterium]|nr:beta-lactamase family protein [Armatimonadota bacterium]
MGTKIDSALTKISNAQGAVLVAKGHHVLLNKGYGYACKEENFLNTKDTAFAIGSLTKCLTAVAILHLEQEGKLSVNDKITKFFDNVPAEKQDITVHELLIHTAGLGMTNSTREEGGDFAKLSKAEGIRRILNEKLLFTPGSKPQYSNNGYVLLAAIIEAASGMTWENYIRSSQFKPAHMSNSGFFAEKLWKPKNIAVGYGRRKFGRNSPDAVPGLFWGLKGAGGIVSSPKDMFAWYQAIMDGRILNSAERAKWLKGYVQYEGRPAQEGYGLMVQNSRRNTPCLNAGGGNMWGFRASITIYPVERVFVFNCTNSDETDFMQFNLAELVPLFGPVAPGQMQRTVGGERRGGTGS